ncbi:MAG: diacylglycerol kinase family protein [Nevskia sp.]
MRSDPLLQSETLAGPLADPDAARAIESAPQRLGVIRNPRSLRNRTREDANAGFSTAGFSTAGFSTAGFSTAGFSTTGIEIVEIEPRSADDLPEVVQALSRLGIRHLVVDGGDGTLRDVMSALPLAYGHRLPTLTVFAGGNANLASADVGSAGHGSSAMPALLQSLATPGAGRITRRRPIELRWPDGSHAPVLGFFIGAASFYRGWKLALGGVHQRGFLHGPAVAATLAAAAWKTIAGGRGNVWQAGAPMDVKIDDQPAVEGQHFMFLATSLHRLLGSLWPFYDHGERHIRWLDIDAPPPRFALALPSLLRGRPKPWMRASGAYRSGGADVIQLRLESPIVVDGEAFTPGAYGIVELHAGPEIAFYTPAAVKP